MTTVENLKVKKSITRVDIANLLSSIGKPGEKRDEKLAALEELNLKNRQGFSVALTADSYSEW